MIAVVVDDDPSDNPKEVGRVTSEGEVIGDGSASKVLQNRLDDESDLINNYTDG